MKMKRLRMMSTGLEPFALELVFHERGGGPMGPRGVDARTCPLAQRCEDSEMFRLGYNTAILNI